MALVIALLITQWTDSLTTSAFLRHVFFSLLLLLLGGLNQLQLVSVLANFELRRARNMWHGFERVGVRTTLDTESTMVH